jgi:toxin-antitoxin system PIN domain toxin
VIIPDVNLLLYAVDADNLHHDAVAPWWHATLDGREAVGVVEGWLRRPHVTPVEPTHRHLGIVRGLLAECGGGGNLVTDAHLAALAIEHGATLHSADHDFARFRGLTWRSPLRP